MVSCCILTATTTTKLNPPKDGGRKLRVFTKTAGLPKRFNDATEGIMKTLLIAALSTIAAGVLLQAPAVAQTPAGQMSAKEGICSSLPGQKPGLNGGCAAGCEAQKPDGVVSPGASKNAPNRIITASYDKEIRDDAPATPCAKSKTPCPCWDESGFDSALPKPAQIQSVQAYGRRLSLRIVSI